MKRSSLSTADARREAVVDAALSAFAAGGYAGTTMAAVGTRAGISTAYVFKLFPSKEQLFVTALDRCFDLVVDALSVGARAAREDATPVEILDAMGEAYAALIADRRLLMMQVHAQSAAEVPEVGSALRRGLAKVTEYASGRSGAEDPDVQRFIAFGQLCHLVVTAGLDDLPDAWARTLTAGIRHPTPEGGDVR